ncbi:MAG: gamma-glutamyltransferase family protein [Alphaproteobacteria bacterium]
MNFVNPARFTTRPEIEGTFGVVTSTHWIATAVGMGILERGGNAFDAACATAFTLQVVEPHLNGPGGDVPVILYDVRRGKPEVICGQGSVPAGATIKHYRDELGLDLVPGTGLLATCIPGTFDTWMTLLRDYGTMRVADVLSPAIGYARNGYPLVERVCATIDTVKDLFRDHWPTSAALYLRDGKPPKPGTYFTNPTMADTYERILREAANGGNREAEIERARAAWSKGFVAEAIDKFCRTQEVMDTSGRRHRGVLTADDMAKWQATVEAPISYDYGRYTVLKANTWTQGLVVLQQLALAKGFDFDNFDPRDPDFIHYQVECAKLAFADRDTFYGDPKFVDVPIDVLLSDAYNDARRKLITKEASHEIRPGKIDGFGKTMGVRLAEGARAAVANSGAGEPTVGNIPWTHDEDDLPDALAVQAKKRERMGATSGDTVHFDIIDRDGNMISSTPSGGWLHSSPVIPELGFPLGTRAQMFWLEEGHPASLAPGKRPRSTLTPTLALRDGEPYLAWGSPGGDQQDQWITQFFLRHVHAGMNLQEAIDAPAWHTEHFLSSFWPRTARPGVVVLEGRVPKATQEELKKRGHKVEVGPDWSEGRLTAASRDGKRRRAAANPRGMQGYAAGR